MVAGAGTAPLVLVFQIGFFRDLLHPIGEFLSGIQTLYGQSLVPETPHHVEIEHGHGFAQWITGIADIVLASQKADLFGRESNEDDATPRSLGMRFDLSGDFQQGNDS